MSWNRPYVVALRLHREGNLDDTLIGTSALICSYKGVARLHHLRGKIYFDLKKYELALEDFNEAVRLEKMKPEYYGSRGVLHLEMNKLKEAERDLRYSNYLSQDRLRFDYSLGNIYFQLNDFQQAAHQYRRAINKGVGGLSRKYLGICYMRMNDFARASHQFIIAEDYDPMDFFIQFGIGRCEYEFGKKEVKKTVYEILDDPDNFQINSYAISFFTKALSYMKKTKALKKNDPLAYYLSGEIYVYLRELKLAEKEFSKAVSLKPDNAELYDIWKKINNLI